MKTFTEILTEGGKGDKEAYQKFFNKMLKKYGVDKGWKSDDEEEGIEEGCKKKELSESLTKRAVGDILHHKASAIKKLRTDVLNLKNLIKMEVGTKESDDFFLKANDYINGLEKLIKNI